MQILEDESFSFAIHADHLSPTAIDVIGGDNVTPSLGLAVEGTFSVVHVTRPCHRADVTEWVLWVCE